MPPHPVDRPIASRGARLPVGAWDGEGRDVMAALEKRDRRFVAIRASGCATSVPTRRPFKGFAPLHALELDLGDLPAGAPVRLLMHGFTDYFTATSVFAAHQANVTAVLPWVEAQRAGRHVARISDDIGFPAGLLRTMTADLTGKLPAGARRIRIWTNLKIYWDQVLVDTTPDGAVPVRRTEIPLAEASLAFRGFPRELTGTPATDLQYVHGEVSKYGPYARHRGFYTKYGAVTPLLHARRGSVRRVWRRRRGRAGVRRRGAAAAAVRMDARLLRLLQRVREGHGLLRRARADGRRRCPSRACRATRIRTA